MDLDGDSLKTHIILLVISIPWQVILSFVFVYVMKKRTREQKRLFDLMTWSWILGFIIWAIGVIGILQELTNTVLALAIGVPLYIVWIVFVGVKVTEQYRNSKRSTR